MIPEPPEVVIHAAVWFVVWMWIVVIYALIEWWSTVIREKYA